MTKSSELAHPSPSFPTVNPEALIARAIEKGVPIEALEKLLAMREQLVKEQARIAFFSALSKFQGECPVIEKNRVAKIVSKRTGSEYSYNYAPIDTIANVIGPILAKHGLSYAFKTQFEGGGSSTVVNVTCIAYHVSGHHEESPFKVPIDALASMSEPQKVAAASTFARRYALCSVFGIVTGEDDNDGSGFDDDRDYSQAPPERQPPKEPKPKKPTADAQHMESKDPTHTSNITMPASALGILRRKMKEHKIDEPALCDAFKVEKLEAMAVGQFNAADKWVSNGGKF